ncbi:MAG TPA: adenylate/guanylate cyclase domain-containing protein [Treponemataceae bacterium]|nr:adenylate/guanylate cyclase domain-containing protein [Treponemataceae bacterium]
MIDRLKTYRVLDALSGLLFIAWFLLPVSIGVVNARVPSTGIQVFYPWSLPLEYSRLAGLSFPSAVLYLVYLVPAIGLFKIVCFVIPNKLGDIAFPDGVFSTLARIAATAIMTFSAILPMLRFADTPSWFAALPVIAIAGTVVSFAGNVASIVIFLKLHNLRNPVYREYREFKKQQGLITMKEAEARRGRPNALEVLFRIRTKLFIAFIGIISLILLVLSVVLLGNYRTTILKAVGDAARTQVEQTSAIYRVNLGDSIAMFEYLNRQDELNKKAEFSYDNLTIYTNLKGETYLDALGGDTPDFRAEYSTADIGTQYPSVSALPAADVTTYAKSITPTSKVISIHDGENRLFRYVSPIIKQNTVTKGDEKTKRERLLGFSVMTFREDVVMRPYYLTRVSVIVFTAFFLYLAIVLTYLVGNYIVNPLLFLRMNVRKISDILSTMIRGQSRISSTALVYNDCVHSHDEIKNLSSEINDMVTVIRGIVPYISASTLKHAESGTTTTMRKELTFIFTDIRGFTTLCEGMEPEEVVTILNRYLDLETEIILNNHGDVDKFVGDEMMAFFEGPRKEENACRAAMQIRAAMMKEREDREKQGLPVVSIGIGINTGNVVFGSVGARDRMDFTSIGDTVNLAARLEGANKAYGSKSIITEAVYERVKEQFLCRELDFIAVKGKNEPVRIYEILQEIPEAHPKLLEIKNNFEKGLTAYRTRKWDKAGVAFKKNIDLFNDHPSTVFLERVEHFTKHEPPQDWDGVFRMTVK